LEGTQIDLVHLCEEVCISTDEFAKSATIWYPKYEAVACIVSELSFKLEQTDEKIWGIYCDENLLKHMAQLSKSKVQGLKDMVLSSILAQCQPQFQNILEQVENENLAHYQVNLHTCGIYTCNCFVFHYPFSNLWNIAFHNHCNLLKMSLPLFCVGTRCVIKSSEGAGDCCWVHQLALFEREAF